MKHRFPEGGNITLLLTAHSSDAAEGRRAGGAHNSSGTLARARLAQQRPEGDARGPARVTGGRWRPRRPDLQGILSIPISNPHLEATVFREGSHGWHNNEKRGTTTYQIGELRSGAGRRPLACSSDEAQDRSPSDVGDEEREMRHPHPSGVG
jgi:hypothetical protein